MTHYIAAVSTPGYLPETEPTYFDSIEDAWEYLADERDYEVSEAPETPEDCTCIGGHIERSGDAIRKHETIGWVWLPSAGRCESDSWDLGRAYSVDVVSD